VENSGKLKMENGKWKVPDNRTVPMPGCIVITGPTATGKTAVGALLGAAIGGEVVSADSMQVYEHMDIGTAKPAEKDMLGVPHHLLSIVKPWEDYSAARYISDASNCINDIIERKKIPIIAGGTGLYIESLLSGRSFSARADEALRKSLEEDYDRTGGEGMLKRLEEFDSLSAKRLYANDKRRIVRAFEVYLTTGKAISQHDIETKALPPRYNAMKVALTFSSRAELYSRIDKRVLNMISDGLEKEVRSLLDMGVRPDATSMQAIGYKEMVGAVLGQSSIEDAAKVIQMQSRRYAKRQLSWLRRDGDLTWITWEKTPDISGCVKRLAEQYEKK